MKIIEIVLAVSVIISFSIYLSSPLLGGELLIISCFTLAFVYMLFGCLLLNGLSLRKLSFKGLSTTRILGTILTGLALAMTVIGIQFRVMWWENIYTGLIPGLIGLTVAFLVSFYHYQKKKDSRYKQLFARIALYGSLGFILLLFPADTWFKIKFAAYPSYLNAGLEAFHNPDKPELREKARTIYQETFEKDRE
ncbi:MAG: hypothetical protein AAF587_37285 [Bacteroidota bacterium]